MAELPVVTALKEAGWIALQEPMSYRKGTWRVHFDTGSWMEIGTEANQRVFYVPVPRRNLERWCVNLIEHLCSTDDEVRALRQRT